MNLLEDKPAVLPAKHRHLADSQPGDIHLPIFHRPQRRLVHAGEHIQKRRFPGAGGPHNHRKVSLIDRQIQILQHMLLKPSG